ncbi:MAG TPA: N-acetyl-gamma-glutamyl-phosphate reductase, partial [Actinomycetota bacterium]|nr:N-acetyl-gamma-glutamyl-phosphate reductase [Actinomycetota bacterium]
PLTPLAMAAATAADVCFSALPSGVLGSLIDEVAAPLVIDLADDHRAEREWVYGLPEMTRAELAGARRVANPGCYPTAVLLALVPFAHEGLIEGPVIVDALSGVSGAGKNVDESYLFASLHGSATAYGTTRHRHVPEMERGLSSFGGIETGVSFTPHLVPMARGLLATCRARWIGDADPNEILRDAYAKESFVHVSASWPSTKGVAGTNRASLHATLDVSNDLLVVSCAIDNLGKGAAGQAIQNANIALGLDETLGLEGVAVWP